MFIFPEPKPLFQDPAHQAQLERDGFIVLPYYSVEEVVALTQLYEELHPKEETGFYPSTFSQDKHYRKTVDEEITRLGQRSQQAYLKDFQVVNSSFIVKHPGPESFMQLHQDMTLVDESRFQSINIWCPLVDLTPENGPLFVLPRSHRIMPTYRGSTIPAFFVEIQEEIKAWMKPLYLKAGEAVFFDQSILHYSPQNTSQEKRIVTNTFFTHQEAEFRIAYAEPETHPDEVELFRVEKGFMTDYEQFGQNIFNRPNVGESLGWVPYVFPKMNLKQVEERYGPCPHPERLPQAQTAPVSVSTTPKLTPEPTAPSVEAVAPTPAEPPISEQTSSAELKDEAAYYSPEYLAWKNRSFWQTYTPLNIYREIRIRLGLKP